MGKKAQKAKKRARRAADAELVRLGRRLREEPRMREFPRLGWVLFLMPLDLIDSRLVARMLIGTRLGLKPDEICDLQARRLELEDEPERIWWVMAVRAASVEHMRRPREA